LRRPGRRDRPLIGGRRPAPVPARAADASPRAGEGRDASHACGQRDGHRDDEPPRGRDDGGGGPPDDRARRRLGRRAASPDAARPEDDLPGLWATISTRIALLWEGRRDAHAAELTVFDT